MASWANSDYKAPGNSNIGGIYDKYDLKLYIDDGFGGIDIWGAKVTCSNKSTILGGGDNKKFREYFKDVGRIIEPTKEYAHIQSSAMLKSRFQIQKSNDNRMLTFGWANVSLTEEGEQIEDWQQDMIDREV